MADSNSPEFMIGILEPHLHQMQLDRHLYTGDELIALEEDIASTRFMIHSFRQQQLQAQHQSEFGPQRDYQSVTVSRQLPIGM